MFFRSNSKGAVRNLLLATSALAILTPFAADAAESAAAAPPAAESSNGDIVVTAQRRAERLQDVPIAVTAISGNQLEKLGIDGSKQLTQVTPGLNFTQSVYSPQPTIRGIGTRGVGAGDESVVPIFIDGVYQPFLSAQDLQFNSVQRVEVLKGPQGALLGRNATGGAINIITRTPSQTPTGAVSLSYGNFNDWAGKGYFSAGIAPTLAGDISVVANTDDGYIKDIITGKKYGGLDDISLRSKLHWTPSTKADVTLSVGYVNNTDSSGEGSQPLNGNSVGARIAGNTIARTPYTAALTYVPYNKLRQYSGSLVATYHFDGFDLTSLTGYQNNHLKIKADSDATPLELVTLQYGIFSRNVYEEVYASSTGNGPFSWLVGGVYFHDTSGYNPPIQTLAKSVSTAGVVGTQAITQISSTLGTDSWAGYAQGAYRFNPQWSLTVGGRYTSEDKDIRSIVGTTTLTTLSNSATFSKFTPSASLQYETNSNLNIYVKAGQAFKSGIFNASATTVLAIAPVQPETVTQYEFGIKSQTTPWLRLEGAVYYTDYKKLQSGTRDPVTLASVVQNAGSAKIYGFDGSAIIRASERLNIRVGASALHGAYDVFPAAQVTTPTLNTAGVPIGGNTTIFIDAHGKKLIRTPFLTGSLGADYTLPLASGDVVFTGNLYYSGKSYWDILNRLEEKPYTLANGEVTYEPRGTRYRFTLWGENLFDEQYDTTVVTSGTADTHVYARPRSYGVRVSYDW